MSARPEKKKSFFPPSLPLSHSFFLFPSFCLSFLYLFSFLPFIFPSFLSFLVHKLNVQVHALSYALVASSEKLCEMGLDLFNKFIKLVLYTIEILETMKTSIDQKFFLMWKNHIKRQLSYCIICVIFEKG